MKKFFFDQDSGQIRLDLWLAQQLAGELSRSRIQSLIKQGCVSINGQVICEIKFKLTRSCEIDIVLPEPIDDVPKAESISLDVLYEDQDLIVINKPAGLVVHPGHGNWQGTLVNALLSHCGESLSGIGGVRRPGIVHRLDKNTSGVMVVAKNDQAHQSLSAQFADHGRTGALHRTYIAFVWGALEHCAGRIETCLGRDPRDRIKQAVVSCEQFGARRAVTHYQVQACFAEKEKAVPVATVVECSLETGRTHQIRVHMAHIGHPLIGDPEYGKAFRTKINLLPAPLCEDVKKLHRQALHAQTLQFVHPQTQEILKFVAPLPEDLQQLLTNFRLCCTKI